MPRVFIVQPSYEYVQMFKNAGWEISYSALDSDLIQFTGGADVSPRLYGESLHPNSTCNMHRDSREKAIFEEFHKKTPMAGICRGGQLLNVLCGGRMYQHYSGHPHFHKATNNITKEKLLVSSTHHQMMIAAPKGEVFLEADVGVVAERMEDRDVVYELPEKEVEGVFYKEDKVLCFQPHPEFVFREGSSIAPCRNLYFWALKELLSV